MASCVSVCSSDSAGVSAVLTDPMDIRVPGGVAVATVERVDLELVDIHVESMMNPCWLAGQSRNSTATKQRPRAYR